MVRLFWKSTQVLARRNRGASGVNVAGAVAEHLNNRLEAFERQQKEESELQDSASDEPSMTTD